MEFLSYILLGLLALFLGLLAIPLRFSLHLERDDYNTVLRYGPFTVFDSSKPAKVKSTKVGSSNKSESEKPESPQPSASQKPKSKRSKRSIRKYFEIARQALVLTPQVMSATLRLGYRTLKKARIDKLEGYLGGGLDDPALTGELAGYGYAIAGALPVRSKRFRIEPDYMAERLEYELDATVSFRPISVLPDALRFARELPKRRIYQLIKTFRKNTDE